MPLAEQQSHVWVNCFINCSKQYKYSHGDGVPFEEISFPCLHSSAHQNSSYSSFSDRVLQIHLFSNFACLRLIELTRTSCLLGISGFLPLL